MNVDPLGENFYGLTPYAYVADSPLIFIDPDGRELRFSFKGFSDEERKEAVTFLEGILNRGFNGFATASIDSKGNVTVTKTDKEGIDDEGNE